MAKRIGMLLVVVVIAMVSLLSVANPQTGRAWKKTITLPNGDVILDMNGEWEAFVENYGEYDFAGSYPQIEKITQTGSSFVAIRMMDDPWNFKGSQAFQGELDKTGIKSVTIFSRQGPLKAKGQISEDGNKIIIDDGERATLTLTRK
jgi:hypothetical protein